MWLLTTIGFFSVVRKSGDEQFTVRARVRGDLDALRERYLPLLGPTIEGGGTDYPYRAKVDTRALAEAVERMVEDIDYSNFKSAISARQGHERAHAYGEVWSVLYRLSKEED